MDISSRWNGDVFETKGKLILSDQSKSVVLAEAADIFQNEVNTKYSLREVAKNLLEKLNVIGVDLGYKKIEDLIQGDLRIKALKTASKVK